MGMKVTMGVALVAMTLAGCGAMHARPATPAPASGAKLAEISGRSFESGKARLMDAGQAQVDEAVQVLEQHPELRVTVDGHTDSAGHAKANQRLSERRARMVADLLIEKGIAADRLTVRGFGESQPVADNHTADGRSRNRRVEIAAQ
jgi:OOP family OmpA-OmpF porin